MIYEDRQYHAHKMLGEAAWEAKQILIVGAGIWLEALEKTLIRALQHDFSPFTKNVRVIPALFAEFHNQGSIKIVDFGSPARAILQFQEPPPDLLYLVDDSPGVNLDHWNRLVLPHLHGTICPIIVVGDLSVEPQ